MDWGTSYHNALAKGEDHGAAVMIADKAECKTKRKPITEAIQIIEAARQTHVEWAEYLDHPEIAKKYTDYCNNGGPYTVGEAQHHHQYIKDYDKVLVVLKEARKRVSA